MQKIKTCAKDSEINDYLSGKLSPERKLELENHFADCTGCLDKLVFAHQTVKEFGETGLKGRVNMKSKWVRHLWLIGAIITFILSFLFREYFLQFLTATALLGAKWIFDSVNARILIMIYEAWKKGGKDEAARILDRF